MTDSFERPYGPPDADLIARVLASDDRHAFAELVRRYQSDVRNLCRRLTGNASSADGFAQNFLNAYRGLPKYRGGARFSTWLYRIAYNLFLSQQRRDAGRQRETPEPSSGEAELPSTSDQRWDLERALGTLRPEERAALVLTYARDVSHEEAAKILGCPLGTLKTNVARGKAKLRELLIEESTAHGLTSG